MLSSYPKFSIVTITLNRRNFLQKAIESVRQQTYDNYEHIVIDGGSTDGTLEVLRGYSHIKWISEPDHGQADAMNKAVRMINGDIFGWLNSDDSYPPNTLEIVRGYFAGRPTVGLLYGTCAIVNASGKKIGETRFHRFDLQRIAMGFNNINTPAVFVSTTALKEAGLFDVSLRATYDQDMWIRIATHSEVLPIPETLSNLCLHVESGLVSSREHVRELAVIRERHWRRRTVTQRYVKFPYLCLREWLYHFVRFKRFLTRMN